MNTHHALTLATVCAALCLGATACGSEGSDTSPAASVRQAAGQQQESRVSPRVAERQAELEEQAREPRAKRAHAVPHSPAGVEGWAR